jgi:hypothetical protein
MKAWYTEEHMNDERLYRASLKVASALLTGLAAALLIELPFIKTADDLTYHVLFCILTLVIATTFERELQS